MKRYQILDKIQTLLVYSLSQAANTLELNNLRQSSIDAAVKDFMARQTELLSARDLIAMLETPNQLYKAFALYIESVNHTANTYASTLH